MASSRTLPISACITTKNNSDTIRECLESVDGFVDEIVIVDTNSSDGTVQICRSYGAQVHNREFTGIADMKREAINLATNQWVFVIDSDEVLTRELKKEIREKFTPEINALYIKKNNLMFGKNIRVDHPMRPLLAKKDHIFFKEDYVMEKLSYRGDESKTIKLNNKIKHYIYENTTEYIDKHNQYSSLEAIRYHDNGKSPSIIYFIIRGLAEFSYYYFYKLGILDGYHGVFWSGMRIWYNILKYQKMVDLQRLKDERDDWREEWLKICER